ncbi:MAG: hypothetical protein JW969_15345 [Spirochaetales bacterium]|nr:hypothetical protein [Spirochaetales bacterium]
MKKIDRVTELSILYEISSLPLRLQDLNKIIHLACDKATSLLGNNAACFYIYDGDAGIFKPAAASGLAKELFLPLEEKDLNHSIAHHFFEDDTLLWEPYNKTTDPHLLKNEYKTKREIISAVRVEDELFGFLYILRFDDEPFDATEKLLLANLINRITICLENDQILRKKEEKESQLKATLTELERSNKDLETFAYVISHDLQEPLRMVKSFLKLLHSRYGNQLDVNAQEYIDFAMDGSARMQKMIKALLDYSRIDSNGQAFERIDCTSVMKDIENNLMFMIKEKKARIIYDTLPVIMADYHQVCQLFQNIIQNSLKFAGDDPPEISISTSKTDDFWEFRIKDNGIGVDQQFKDRIFMIFERLHTSKEYPGTGIGLAICKKIVERHGGIIRMESGASKGALLYFTLPGYKNGDREST